MPTLVVGFNATTRDATVVEQGTALPAGSINIGTFVHPDETYPDSLVIYHGVRDLLYKRSHANPAQTAMFPDNITDMNRIRIVSTLLPAVPVDAIYIAEKNPQVEVGSTLSLTISFSPTTATNRKLVFSSSNEAVATVSDAGVITGVAAGNTSITVKSEDGGKQASTVVTVIPTQGAGD